MGVPPEEQRAGDPGRGAVLADRLAGGGDVVLVEREVQRRAAVPGGAEGDLLRRLGHVGMAGVVGRDERGDVDEVGSGGGLASPRVGAHGGKRGRLPGLLARGGEARCPTGCSHLPGEDPEPLPNHLDLVMAAADVGWFDWDVRADYLVFDDRMCGLFGIDPATFDHRVASFWATLHPDDSPDVEAAVAAALETCGEYAGRVPGPAAGRAGSAGWRPGAGSWPGDDGLAERMLGVARDSTDQRLAKDTVARALEHMADGFLSVDRDWRVTYVNRNAEVFVGPTVEALRPDPVGGVAAPGHARLRAAGPPRPRAPGRRSVFTKYVVEADRWFQVRVVPHQDGLSFFATDVTATRAAELERERALTRPDQARAVLAYSAALAEADTLADVIEVVATMVLPAFGATGMLVSLLESNRLKLAGHSGYSAAGRSTMLDVLSPDDDLPIAEVLRTREPLFLPSRAAYLGKFPGRADADRRDRQAGLGLPAAHRVGPGARQPHGQLRPARATSRRTSGRCWSVSSGLLAQTLARARLRDHERTLAAELQQQLLPRALPRPQGLVATARYLAATDGMGVGGDWYDVLELPGHRVALVIGDVQGHTMQAAAVMGQLRNALRAYAAEGHEPAAVMSRTNRLMVDLDPGVFATCAIVSVDLRSSQTQLVLAGHPPPVRRTAAGATSVLDAPVGPPLGVVEGEEYAAGRRAPWTAATPSCCSPTAWSRTRPGPSTRAWPRCCGPLRAAADRRPRAARRHADRHGRRPGPPLRRHRACWWCATTACPRRPARCRPGPRSTGATRGRPGRPATSSPPTWPAPSWPSCARPRCCWSPRWSPTRCGTPTAGWSSSCGGSPTGCGSRCPTRPRAARSPAGGGLLDESGRGVPLMDALSDRWGTSPHGAGKVVWFELDLPRLTRGAIDAGPHSPCVGAPHRSRPVIGVGRAAIRRRGRRPHRDAVRRSGGPAATGGTAAVATVAVRAVAAAPTGVRRGAVAGRAG